MKLVKNSSEGSRTSQRKNTLNSLQACQYGYNIDKIHLGNQLQCEPMYFQLILDHAREWH